MSKPISDLCNLSITSEKFPDICKVAELKPLYKKGSLTEPCNYRLKSLLPLLSKVMKKVIHDHKQVLSWIRKTFYTLINLVFERKHSEDFCLSYVNDKISKGFNKGMMTGMILIDLQKAFGTTDHGTMTCYCKSYLLLISRNILLIGLSLIFPSDLFWLI